MKDPTKQLAALACVFLSLSFCAALVFGDEPTAKQKRSVNAIAKVIDRADRLYKSKKYESSAEKIIEAEQQIMRLATEADADLISLIQPEYDRLAQQHKLLIEQGQKLQELKPLPAPIVAGMKPVSFKSEVAPILISNCGRCHVRARRGNFSAASYRSLMDSTHVSSGMPNKSRLIERIVDGEMPPDGKVAEKDLESLKQWIAQGAKFDGEGPGQDITALTGMTLAPDRTAIEVSKPTGNETVSFGLDVAPILIKNCASCHIDRNPPRGGLSMATFMQLLRGGDSGNLLVPGTSADSSIVRRLQAEGATVMPPTGKLDAKWIDLITKWIDEGAKYDGGDDSRIAISMVAAVANANSQTHEVLFAERNALALKSWKLIMSDRDADVVPTKRFRIVGNSSTNRLESVGKISEELAEKITDTLKADQNSSFIKGGATIYVFDRRYDFNELGMMLVGHELPREAKSHWSYDGVDAYAAILLAPNESAETATVQLCRQLAAIYVASLAPDVPRWFADGVGHYTAAKILSREDETKAWDNAAQQVLVQLESPGDFATGKISESDAALASYLFIKNIKSNGQLVKLLGLMHNGSSFDNSFSVVFGKAPDEFFMSQKSARGRR